ncbi:inner centromere protein isoform X2 [Heptranchias perlo]
MASRTAITMDTDNILKCFGEKLNAVIEDFKENEVWLKEIQEEARKMFLSDFNAEPELMPKTPSERKRRRRRPSVAQDPKRFSRSRKSLRRSSIQRTKLRSKDFEEGCNKIVEQAHPVRLTRSAARALATANPETEKPNVSPIVPVNGRMLLVVLSLNDRKSVELHHKGQEANLAQTLLTSEDVKLPQKALEAKAPPPSGPVLETLTPTATAVIPRSPNREATKLKIADAVTSKENGESGLAGQELSNALGTPAASENSISEDENQAIQRAIRRSVRKSIASRRSNCIRLVDKYSLNVQRNAMAQKSMRKSLRKSIVRRKNVLETSASSYQNGTDKMEGIEKECVDAISSTLLELEQPKEEKQPGTLIPENQERRCTRNAMKIAISNLEKEVVAAVSKPQACRRSSRKQRKDSSDSEKLTSADSLSVGRKRSYKCAVANICNYSDGVLEQDDSPPRKKTSSPRVTTSKVVRPKHKSFLHAVQKNQLLMTPMSVGRTMVKSFIKRNTPLKVDPKEQEKIRLANLKKKQEQEEERIQKVEEEKKRKLEEFKKKREMQVKRVLETRSRVQRQEEEKKRKIVQKFAQIDEKNAKVREERFAEEKAKKKVAAKRMEGAETRRRQEEEARNQKLQQLEEEECKRQELLQHKKEEELERQRKMAEARKLQEQRQAELERERQRELQLAADRERERRREQERIQAEKERERLAKERALQLQRELERTAREDAALQAQQEKEKLRKEAREKDRKQEEQQLAELERQRLEKEKTRKEQERLQHERQENEKRLREDEERKWKEEQDRKAEKEVTSKNILNVTVEVHHSPAPESYTMTPNGYSKLKLPKINLDNYGMDLNSDDSTDDEGAPRKPIPAWADGKELQQALIRQYYHPPDLDKFFGVIQPPNLETIFGKSKPRYLKRTSSAVWHSPPLSNSVKNVPFSFRKY